MSSATQHQPDPNLPNKIKFDIEGKTVLLLTVEGMTYNGQLIQDAGEAHKALVDTLTAARDAQAQDHAAQAQRLVQEMREFAKWSEGIFQEYASLKPDDCDAPEVQAETAASIEEDRRYLRSVMAALDLQPEGEDESWIYEPEFILEIVTNGMVEGGYMPDIDRLVEPPGPTREEMIGVVKRTLEHAMPDINEAGLPMWVAEMLKALTEDEEFMLSLCHEACKKGWVDGRRLFDGCEMQCWTPPPGAPDNLERMRQLWAKFSPPTKPEEPPAEPGDGPPPTAFSVGSYVTYKPGRGVLHCGSGTYARAVVASMDPFVLVSKSGDMLWRSTVKAEDFAWEGEAERFVLLAVLDRFKREIYRDVDQALGEASL